jgi:hypothetical protein
MTNELFATAVMATAKEKYNDGGWDVIVECWTAEEINNVLANCDDDVDKAWEIILSLVDIWADRQADAINSAF